MCTSTNIPVCILLYVQCPVYSAVPDKLVQDACQFPDYPETFVATVQVACYYRGTDKKKK